MAKAQELQAAADKVNQILNEATTYKVFVLPSKRALKWFNRYEVELAFKGKDGAGYSISRTDARWQLFSLGIDLDAMLAEVGLS